MAQRRPSADPYMMATLREAKVLQSGGHYKAAITTHVEYLHQLLLTATAIYYDRHDRARLGELQNRVFKLKQEKSYTLGAIISGVPRKLRKGEFDEACRYVQSVRNDILAHPYYVVSLSRISQGRHEIADVGARRKYIQSIYRHVEKRSRIPEVVHFLTRGHPLAVYPNSDLRMIECERLIMQQVAINVEKAVRDVDIALEVGLGEHAYESYSLYKWQYVLRRGRQRGRAGKQHP